MEDLLTVLGPYLGEIGVLVAAVVAAVALFLVTRAVRNDVRIDTLLKQYQWLSDVAIDVVVRVAFHATAEELALYQEEAERTGRDVRLVIAYNELGQIAAEHGIKVDVNRLIGLIEEIYQRLNNIDDEPTLSAAPPLWQVQENALLVQKARSVREL